MGVGREKKVPTQAKIDGGKKRPKRDSVCRQGTVQLYHVGGRLPFAGGKGPVLTPVQR